MALIKCPECGKEISDRAGSCPGCGYKLPRPKKRVNKKLLGIGGGAVVIIVVIILIMKQIMTIPTDSELSESVIGKERGLVNNLMRSESDSLSASDNADWYKKQKFFGMTCELVYYYDKNEKVEQITYIKWLDDKKENIEDYQKNIDAIIDYYTNDHKSTKGNEWERVDFDSDYYQYNWWNMSQNNKYSLEVKDNEITMTVQ